MTETKRNLWPRLKPLRPSGPLTEAEREHAGAVLQADRLRRGGSPLAGEELERTVWRHVAAEEALRDDWARVVAHHPPGARLEDVGKTVRLLRETHTGLYVVEMPDKSQRTMHGDALRLCAGPIDEIAARLRKEHEGENDGR